MGERGLQNTYAEAPLKFAVLPFSIAVDDVSPSTTAYSFFVAF